MMKTVFYMIILFLRTVIVYGLVVFSLRIMGKRQIGELQPSELVVAIMISDLATLPMSDVSVPLLYGIVPIFTLVICEVLLSFVCLKSERVRVILSGKPQVLIKNGKLNREEMLHARMNIDDLMEELRMMGYFSLSDIDTVILETGGNISVVPKGDATPTVTGDFGIKINQTIIPPIYISDGKIRQSELKRMGRNENWLKKTLKKSGINSVENVFVLSEDGDGNIFLQKKDDNKNER